MEKQQGERCVPKGPRASMPSYCSLLPSIISKPIRSCCCSVASVETCLPPILPVSCVEQSWNILMIPTLYHWFSGDPPHPEVF